MPKNGDNVGPGIVDNFCRSETYSQVHRKIIKLTTVINVNRSNNGIIAILLKCQCEDMREISKSTCSSYRNQK